MNKLVLISALAASLVGGCATTPSTVDTARVDAVDRVARSHGVQVIWLSYPQRKEAVAVAAPAAPTGT